MRPSVSLLSPPFGPYRRKQKTVNVRATLVCPRPPKSFKRTVTSMVTSASPLDLAITPRVVSDCETREFAVRLEGVASVSLQEGFCVLYGFPYRRQPRVRRTAGSLEDVASDETLQSLFFFRLSFLCCRNALPGEMHLFPSCIAQRRFSESRNNIAAELHLSFVLQVSTTGGGKGPDDMKCW